MGWAWATAIGIAVMGLLWLVPATRRIAGFVGAALLFGGAGYALLQHASLPGHPVRADVERIAIDPSLAAFRQVVMPASAADQAILGNADDRLRNGDTTGAVEELLTAIQHRPNDAALWTGLGSALAAHDGGGVSPTALYAFRRAFRLAPNAPGPPFFLGLAYVQSGDLAATKRAWLQALALAPRDAPYRVNIAERLVMIDQFEAMKAAAASAR